MVSEKGLSCCARIKRDYVWLLHNFQLFAIKPLHSARLRLNLDRTSFGWILRPSREYFILRIINVGEGTWTLKDCSIRTWNVRVYLFHHSDILIYYSIFTIFVGLLWWKVLLHPSHKTWHLVTFCSAEYQLRHIIWFF